MAGLKDYPGNALIQALVPDPSAEDKSAELAQARATRDWAMARLRRRAFTRRRRWRRSRWKTRAPWRGCWTAASTLPRPRSTAPGRCRWPRRWRGRHPQAVFLGFGGTRLSEAEQALIAQLREALRA